MMIGTDDQNPLRSRLETELNRSQWLQAFKAINRLLQCLKADIAATQDCDLKWDTSCNGLVIHCPSADIAQQLRSQQREIVAIARYADRITLVQPNDPDIILKA
ncbi:MAG: hypothetical protein AAGI45_24380 [Cyanobacteria bacterium P01_H01_bin.26]